MKQLTDLKIKQIEKPGRYTDPRTTGLHLWVTPALRKYWIYRFTHGGKRQGISLGPYPLVGLKEARERAQRAIVDLLNQRHPRVVEVVNVSPLIVQSRTFRDFALEWVANNSSQWRNQKHTSQWLYTLKNFAFPIVGEKSLTSLTTNDVLQVLEPIWHTKTETASRLRGRMERILAAARVRGLINSNPALWKGHLDAVLPSPGGIRRTKGVRHHRALHYADIPDFMRELRDMEGASALALEFTVLTACRTNEVLGGLKTEISGDVWEIPATRMKSGRNHRVPLGYRAMELLSICTAMNKSSLFLFSNGSKKLSNMAMSAVLRRMGINCTVHGFRSSFRDWVAECTDWNSETAEMALAHTIRNKVEAAYRRGDLLDRRRKLLGDWEAYCQSSNVARDNKLSLRG